MKKDTPPRIAENPSLADYPGIMNLLRIFGSARGLIKAIGLSGPKFDSVAAAANEVLAHESILTLPDRSTRPSPHAAGSRPTPSRSTR